MNTRILFFADSHIGLDLPSRPRVKRRRRGDDFLANHAHALEPALAGEVDVVIHGGDIFDRPGIDRGVAHQAYAPLLRVADLGIPVFIVPGNHERSALPHAELLRHRHVHVFDRPRTFTVPVNGMTLALSGFPYTKDGVRRRLPELLDATSWRSADADIRLLCVHHCIEGAKVGPSDFTFTGNADVIRHRDVPHEFAAVLSGHIHRRQVLTRDLRGAPLVSPVLYPGSVERTSSAEIGEDKGYFILHVRAGAPLEWEERPLYARPLIAADIDAAGMDASMLRDAVVAMITDAPHDAVLQVRVRNAPALHGVLSAAVLRALAPETMSVELRFPDTFRGSGAPRGDRDAAPCDDAAQLELGW